jgi:hypothetical protein
VRRIALLSLFAGCALAGVLAAFALAADTSPGAGTTTAATTTTASTGTTTTAPPQPLAQGVTIGGVYVGGLLPADAAIVVRDAYGTPLPLGYGGLLFAADPNVLAGPNVSKAIERAKVAQPFEKVPLVVVARLARIHAYVATLAKRIDRPAADSSLTLRHLRPRLSREKPGLALDRMRAEREITSALVANRRDTIDLRTASVPAALTRKNFGPVIVIHRGSNLLYLYNGVRYWHVFAVATGQSVYPTPLGRFRIIVKWKNPWWYPPNSPWARGERPIPPGPDNPLGSRWMGISAPGVGIHGTNNESSIGYSVSHGCVRMHVPDAEWLFEHVEIGTPVFIVSA